MADGDEHEERHEQLRARVLELHRIVAQLDAGQPDAGQPDAGQPDAGQPDAGQPDAGQPDAGQPDAGVSRDADPDDGAAGPDLLRAVDELTAATDEFLAFGDRLPVLQDLPARASSVQVVRASALALLLGAVLLGLGVWRRILAPVWLPVLLVMLPAAVRVAMLSVAPASGRHRRQRYVAAASGAAALLVAPAAAVFGWLPGLVCVLVLVGTLAVLLELRWVRS
jgi:hypothetical protein